MRRPPARRRRGTMSATPAACRSAIAPSTIWTSSAGTVRVRNYSRSPRSTGSRAPSDTGRRRKSRSVTFRSAAGRVRRSAQRVDVPRVHLDRRPQAPPLDSWMAARMAATVSPAADGRVRRLRDDRRRHRQVHLAWQVLPHRSATVIPQRTHCPSCEESIGGGGAGATSARRSTAASKSSP